MENEIMQETYEEERK